MLDSSELIIRQRFSECLSMLAYINSLNPPPDHGGVKVVPEEVKYLRGLWLVSLYGAFEKSINSIFNEVLGFIDESGITFDKIKPSLKSVFSHSQIQSIKDCGYDLVLERSMNCFIVAESNERVSLTVNPLTSHLQNVDGNSILFLCNILSISGYKIEQGRLGRLNNLKDRRNAVAHGRDTPTEVGSRFSDGLPDLHSLTLDEVSRFLLVCRQYCEQGLFRRE